MSVERSYDVQVRIGEATKELVPGKVGLLSTEDKTERSRRDIVSLVVTATDAETAIRKAIRLLETELPDYGTPEVLRYPTALGLVDGDPYAGAGHGDPR